MLTRHAADADHEHCPRRESDHGQHDQQVANARDRVSSLRFSIQTVLQHLHRLPFGQRLGAMRDRGDEIVPHAPVAACDREHVKLRRGVRDARKEQRENDGRRDQKEFSIESHSHN